MPRSSRKRARTSVKYKEASTDDEEGSDGTRDSGMEEITGQKMPKKRKSIGKASSVKSKGKEKAKEDDDENKMDVDEDESPSKAGSVRGRAPKPKSTASVPTATPATTKRKPRVPKSAKKDVPEGEELEPLKFSATPAPSKSRPRKTPKSKAIISDSDVDEPRGRKRFPAPPNSSSRISIRDHPSLSPARSHRDKPPRTRSQSRSRGTDARMRVDRMDSVSPTRGNEKPRVKSMLSVSMVSDGSIVPETDDDREAERPQKKRKTRA